MCVLWCCRSARDVLDQLSNTLSPISAALMATFGHRSNSKTEEATEAASPRPDMHNGTSPQSSNSTIHPLSTLSMPHSHLCLCVYVCSGPGVSSYCVPYPSSFD